MPVHRKRKSWLNTFKFLWQSSIKAFVELKVTRFQGSSTLHFWFCENNNPAPTSSFSWERGAWKWNRLSSWKRKSSESFCSISSDRLLKMKLTFESKINFESETDFWKVKPTKDGILWEILFNQEWSPFDWNSRKLEKSCQSQ